MSVGGWLRFVSPCAALTAVALPPAEARAQSAADIATARQLAVQGIKLYDAGNYAEALDKLQRAQALYDAPVHLLYIARCQNNLGQLVESGETYRRLARVQLAADAAQASVSAKRDGERELSVLEPMIPMLRVEVEPAAVQGLTFSIDGQAVSAAVVGVDRPINPGKHQVQVSAPGYESATSSVVLGKGERKQAKLVLQPAAGGMVAGPAAAPPQGAQPGQPPAGPQPAAQPGLVAPQQQQPPAPDEPERGQGVGFLLGARLGGVLPLGGFDSGLAEAYPAGHRLASNSLSFPDVAKAGGGLELLAGLRFAQYYTALLLGSVVALGVPREGGLNALGYEDAEYRRDVRPADRPEIAASVETTLTLLVGGVGMRIGVPRGRHGLFGEAALVYHALNATQQVAFYDPAMHPDCTINRSYEGGALRLGAGGVIPVSGLIQLTPYASALMGSFGNASVQGPACVDEDYSYNPGGDMHVLLGLGIGGEFTLGPDKPAQQP
jgi:hypothetical protein